MYPTSHPNFMRTATWPVAYVESNRMVGEETLLVEEEISVSDKSPIRRTEFATGRWCAREALRRLGVPATPLPRGPFGVPLWPPGTTGSISHTEGLVCAIASRLHRSVGVDVQSRVVNIDSETWAHVSESNEVASLASQGLSAHLGDLLSFCLKEAAFKCLFPLFGRPTSFRHIHLNFPGETGVAEILAKIESQPYPIPWVNLEGRFDWNERHVLTVVWMTRSPMS